MGHPIDLKLYLIPKDFLEKTFELALVFIELS